MLKRFKEFMEMNDAIEEHDKDTLKLISAYSKEIGESYVDDDVANILITYMTNLTSKQELELDMLMSSIYPVDDLTSKIKASSEIDKTIMIWCKNYVSKSNFDIKVLNIIDKITDSLVMHNKIQLLILGQPIQE